jgi:KaiC/GvpD/RAD55 family RecA-like ATPase
MCGKDSIMNTIMASGIESGDAVIFLTTRNTGENVLESFTPPKDANFGIVDCMSRTLGLNVSDTARIKRAASPVDLTGIGVRISQFIEEFWLEDNVRSMRLCMNSLSTFLMYTNLQTVFRFMHVFSGRVAAIDALGVYVVEEGMHDSQTVATLKQLFDAVLEVKIDNDVPYLRLVGLTPKPTLWYEYDVEGDMAVVKGARQ